MDAKSLEILKKITILVQNRQMLVTEFPKNDIIDMLNVSYENEREKRDKEWAESMAYLELLFSEIIFDNNTKEMVDVLNVMSNESDDWKRRFEEKIIIRGYKKKAKEVYQKIYNNSSLAVNKFVGKGVVYTVITGNYDALQDPEVVDENYKYICFTNNPELRSSVWDIRMMDNSEQLDAVRLARKYKILCHEFLSEFDYSIYIDGKIKIIGDMAEYIKRYSRDSAMLCFPHFVRECAYQEAIACIQCGKDNGELIAEQMKDYSLEGYPVENGMIDSACLVRSHNNIELQNVMKTWWNEVKNRSRRDQLSFGYACWKNRVTYDICDLFIYDNPYICKSRVWEAPY